MSIDPIKQKMEEYKSDFEDFAKSHPDVLHRWKTAPRMNSDGNWECDEHARIQEEIRVIAYAHYRSRHPEATDLEVSKAYSSYSSWVRRT